MAEMVGSAVAQEVVSGAFSFMRNNHEELASQSHLLERLKMVHLELKFALERCREMPITEVSLLQRRKMIKQALEECRGVLYKRKLQVNLDDEGAEQRVTPLLSSLPRRIMHAVKPFFSTEKGSITAACVTRFEWFAEKADKFVRDVESGCSLARYRFSSAVITQLLQGKFLKNEMLSGSQTRMLSIYPSRVEDYGAVAYLVFHFKDVETPMKCFTLQLMLRLSESTDIVGISTKCLQSFETTRFKPVADVASGELAQISTQVGFFVPVPAQREILFNMAAKFSRVFRQEPFCCIGDGFQQPCAKNILSSELTEKFPEQVIGLLFECFIAATEYSLQSSILETNRNTIRAWPFLQLSVDFLPHYLFKCNKLVGTYLVTSLGEIGGPLDSLDLSTMADFAELLAVDCFKIEPQRTEYMLFCFLGHGVVKFTVKKPNTEIGCPSKIDDRSKTRRVSKMKR